MSAPSPMLERALAWLKETWNHAPPALRQHWPWFIAGGALLGFFVMLGVRALSPGGDTPNEPVPTARGGVAGAAGAAGAVGDAGGAPGVAPVRPPLEPDDEASAVDAGPPLSPNVKVTFRTFPPRRATVTWGGKRLGVIDRGRPLVVERARDSGPLDVVVRSPGYLPVHARAYTFDDATVDVKITPIEKKDTLFGYQQPLTDAGAPTPPEP